MAAVTKKGATEIKELSDFEKQMVEHADEGISDSSFDNIVPSIKVLQPLSPEVAPEGPGAVPGAKAGDLLLATGPVSGRDGVWFQPCGQQHRWFEFHPMGQGGFIAEHPFQLDASGSPVVDKRGDPIPPRGATSTERFKYVFAGGTQAVHYRQWAGIAWIDGSGFDYVINFKSTGHTIAREWMMTARSIYIPGTAKRMPLWSHAYKLTTSQRRNKFGTFFVFDVGPPVRLNACSAIPDWEVATAMGIGLARAFEAKEKVGAVDSGPADDSGDAL